MDLLSGLMTGRLAAMAGTPGPTDDYWYQPVGAVTAAGMQIDAHGARKISAWYRGRDLLATSLAMLPLQVYRRLPGSEGREAMPQHPLYDVLHRKPNAWQNAFEYRREAMCHVIDHGWHYAELVEGPRGFVDQLRPIDPTRVRPEQVDSGPNRGRWLFHIRHPKTGQTTTKTQDEVFYLRGVDGKGILEYARDSLGLGLTLEHYASKLFSRGAMNGGILEPPPGPLNEDAMKLAATSFKTALGDWHMPRVLPPGTKWHTSTMEPEKAQFILSRKFTVVDIARWLGLPAHMLGEVETAGVTGLEQRGQEFVTFSLGGWLSLWEFGINDQLILRPETYFAEFTRDALVRGDIAVRWEAYVSSVNAGIQTPNEVRRKENLPALPDGDRLREPQNITGRGAKGGPQDNRRPGRSGDPDDDRARAIVTESAERVQRKERFALEKEQARKTPAGFEAFVVQFYEGHVDLVSQSLLIPQAQARLYCESHRDDILRDGLSAMETWTPGELVALALDMPLADRILEAVTRLSEKPAQITLTTPPRGDMRREIRRDPKTGLVTAVIDRAVRTHGETATTE